MGLKYPEEGAVKAVTTGSNSDEVIELVPINWDTLRHRKLKMDAWSKDTTKKQEKRKSRKTGKRIAGGLKSCY